MSLSFAIQYVNDATDGATGATGAAGAAGAPGAAGPAGPAGAAGTTNALLADGTTVTLHDNDAPAGPALKVDTKYGIGYLKALEFAGNGWVSTPNDILRIENEADGVQVYFREGTGELVADCPTGLAIVTVKGRAIEIVRDATVPQAGDIALTLSATDEIEGTFTANADVTTASSTTTAWRYRNP